MHSKPMTARALSFFLVAFSFQLLGSDAGRDVDSLDIYTRDVCEWTKIPDKAAPLPTVTGALPMSIAAAQDACAKLGKDKKTGKHFCQAVTCGTRKESCYGRHEGGEDMLKMMFGQFTYRPNEQCYKDHEN